MEIHGLRTNALFSHTHIQLMFHVCNSFSTSCGNLNDSTICLFFSVQLHAGVAGAALLLFDVRCIALQLMYIVPSALQHC